MSSRRSSESGASVDSEVILEAERLEQEREALKELEDAAPKPVAFSVRTNVSFDAALHGQDAPSPNRVVSFDAREFLHIVMRFDHQWWIGRRVKIGSPLGFIPSPAKLEIVQNALGLAAQVGGLGEPGLGQSSGGKTGMTGGFGSPDATLERGGNRGLLIGSEDPNSPRGPVLAASRRHQSESPPPGGLSPDNEAFDDLDDIREVHEVQENAQQSGVKKAQQVTGPTTRKKVFSRKTEFLAPYEIVPSMRPVVFVGPALKGYEVTDMMQKAIFDAMKKHFDGRIIVSRVSTNISLAKRVGALLHLEKKNVLERGRNRQLITLLSVQQDIEKIFHLGSKMQLLLLDCDTINHPSQISKTCVAPILVYIKIASIRVLQRLIKNRGNLRKKNAGVQTAAAEKLLQCPNEAFDYVIEQNTLDAATEGLINFLEGYWNATHPQLGLSKAERLLGSMKPDVNGIDSDRPLVPMTPGRPGLSVVTKSAMDAGFTSQEINALAGAAPMTVWNTSGEADQQMDETGGTGNDLFDEPNGIASRLGQMTTSHHHKPRLQINAAAHAAAKAAAAAGLVPRGGGLGGVSDLPDSTTTSTGVTASPGLAMGIGMGLATGVAATINAALFQTLAPSSGGHPGSSGQGGVRPGLGGQPQPSPTVAVAAAVTVKPPPLRDLGIHQVEASDGTHIYQSRSARQAKERQAELDRVRREAEAKALAVQATVGGRRRRRAAAAARIERGPRAPPQDDWSSAPLDHQIQQQAQHQRWEPPVLEPVATSSATSQPTDAVSSYQIIQARPRVMMDGDFYPT